MEEAEDVGERRYILSVSTVEKRAMKNTEKEIEEGE